MDSIVMFTGAIGINVDHLTPIESIYLILTLV